MLMKAVTRCASPILIEFCTLIGRAQPAPMWAVMDRFGYKQIPSKLNSNKIHRLKNVLTLDGSVHSAFDELKLWFEPTVSNSLYEMSRLDRQFQGKPNTYKLTAPGPVYIASHWKTTDIYDSRSHEPSTSIVRIPQYSRRMR